MEERAYAKVSWRLVPFLLLCYVAAYLDRVNVGFAKLQMLADLELSETTYGLGAGIFFLGYFLFEVPSNVILHRVGARRWIARIMITWGIVSGLTMFVKTPDVFYVLRFVLGIVEAGFFPGIILYLTYWYPAQRRGRVTALFMLAIPLTGVIGGPLSGFIMDALKGTSGLAGWQWLFLIEAVPSIVLGVLAYVRLDDRVRNAKWLSDEEKELLERALEEESATKKPSSTFGVFREPKVWALSVVYFSLIMGLYGVSFWLPTLIKTMGFAKPLHVGLLSAIPYSAGAIGMALFARSSDVRNERRWHVVLPALIGGIGLAGAAVAGPTASPALGMAVLSVATLGILASLPVFWNLPTALLGGGAAAAGIAMINSLGNLAGFLSPYLVGFVKDATGTTTLALYTLSAFLFFAALVVLLTEASPAKGPPSSSPLRRRP